jgi:hypothetical protein
MFKTPGKPVKAIGQSAKLIGAAEVVLKPGCYAAQPFADTAEIRRTGLRRVVVHRVPPMVNVDKPP